MPEKNHEIVNIQATTSAQETNKTKTNVNKDTKECINTLAIY